MVFSSYRDDDPREIEGFRVLQALFERVGLQESRWDAFQVRPGSLLDGDDTVTAYDPLSYQVRFLFGAAFDHASTLRLSIEKSGMPMVAAYPLIRASIESAAQVLWLTTGNTRGKRAFRALHRIWDMANLSFDSLRHLHPGLEDFRGDLRIRLDGLLRQAKAGQRSLDRDYPSMTDVVIDASRRVNSGEFKPIDVWRLCSSLAHGNRDIAMAILEARPAGGRTPIGADYLMTTSYRVIAGFVAVLAETIDAALDARDKLNA